MHLHPTQVEDGIAPRDWKSLLHAGCSLAARETCYPQRLISEVLFLSLHRLGGEGSSLQMSFITRKWLGPVRSCSDQQDERVWLFRKTHPFALAPVALGHLLSCREGQPKTSGIGKTSRLHPGREEWLPSRGCPGTAGWPRSPSEEVNQPFPASSHLAGSIFFVVWHLDVFCQKLMNISLRHWKGLNTRASQFSHLLRMNSSLWPPSQAQQVNAEAMEWVLALTRTRPSG